MKFVLYLLQAPVVQKVDNAIKPDKSLFTGYHNIGFPNTLIDLCHAAAICPRSSLLSSSPPRTVSLLNIQEGCTLKKGC